VTSHSFPRNELVGFDGASVVSARASLVGLLDDRRRVHASAFVVCMSIFFLRALLFSFSLFPLALFAVSLALLSIACAH
jgi:hypothetical protein